MIRLFIALRHQPCHNTNRINIQTKQAGHMLTDMVQPTWARAQRRAFANDFDNLLVVDDSTNQAKSDQAPHEWQPPLEDYWCEYRERWERIKEKYRLRYSHHERTVLKQLADTCLD
jgi:CRISPR/Cas system Type II protein with McrA/HNH and RuvC-like nuclease domain